MKNQRRPKFVLFSLLFVALTAGLLIAQDDNYPAPAPPSATVTQDDSGQGVQQDPSGRVARFQYMSGEVSTQPGGVNDWIAASQNRPLTTADRVWTDKGARAELNVGNGYIRMNSETSLTLTNVSDQNVQLELDQGVLEVTVRHLEPGEIYEVDTPNYAFTVMKPGTYRFDVYPSEDQSWVTVRSGYGEATGRGNAVRVNSGTQVRFSGGNSLQHVSEDAPSRDGFDDWVRVRDKRLDDSVSARYVSPGVIGYQDLDGYGRWQPTPSYGNVWVPYSVPVGWAPYRFGHWVWIAPWGWTWVDDQPWGFAPFHYGRWVNWGGGWAWAPGPRSYWRPYYAPALVGWIGGSGFSVGFSFGSVGFGWFPLGWGEPYYPRYCGWGHGGWYRGGGYVSNNYFRNVNVTNTNITNITNITNNYYNNNIQNTHYGFRSAPNAVSAAPRAAFVNGAAVNRVGGAVPKANLGRAQLVRGVDVNPTRQSVLGGRAPQTRGIPPASAFNRQVITTNNRPAATRPANLQAANDATIARGTAPNVNRGNPTNPNPGARPAITTPPNNPRVNGPANDVGRSAGAGRNTEVVRGPANNGVPTSGGGRYVPRPPSAGGNPVSSGRPTSTEVQGNGTRNVPHTPATGVYSNPRGNSGAGIETTAPHNVPRPTNDGYSRSNTMSNPRVNNPEVARPPQSSAPGRPMSTPQAQPRQSAPQAEPRGNPHTNSGPGTAMSVPRPPSNYSYRQPVGSAPSGNANRVNVSAPARSYSAAPSYSPQRRSEPGYMASRGYSAPVRSAAPTYQSNRGNSSPAYSGRSMNSYHAPTGTVSRNMGSPAPRPSGGGSSGYRAPSGGGAHVAASNGGGHAANNGGGGHNRR